MGDWVGHLLTGTIVAGASWVAVKTSIARIEQRLDDWDEDYRRRMAMVETRVGLGGPGNGAQSFTRREASEMERRQTDAITEVRDKLVEMDGDVREIDLKMDEVLRRRPGEAG